MWHMIDDFFLQLVLVVWVMVSTGTASRRSRISSQNRVMAAEYVTICHVCHIKTRCHVKLQDVARCCKMLQDVARSQENALHSSNLWCSAAVAALAALA